MRTGSRETSIARWTRRPGRVEVFLGLCFRYLLEVIPAGFSEDTGNALTEYRIDCSTMIG